MQSKAWRWILGITYVVLVAAIWIAASFVVQSVVDAGVSPFLITYICNSLFVIYIPIVEITRYLEDNYGSVLFWKSKQSSSLREPAESENAVLLGEGAGYTVAVAVASSPSMPLEGDRKQHGEIGSEIESPTEKVLGSFPDQSIVSEDTDKQLDAKGRWTRTRMAKIGLLICPFWFLAQLTFNLSLKYTTVTSNTILSTASSIFTFLASVTFLGETFTWVKLVSVLLCMGGTIIVSLGDSQSSSTLKTASNPLLGDVLAIVSAGLYAVYISLIRKKLPDDDDDKRGKASMAQFLGFLGLFNLLIFLPVALIINFTKLEPFYTLTWQQVGLIIGKGLLDNVLSDYLWARAVLLTTATVATAGLTIQVPLAAIVDSLTGNAPHLMDYLGAVAVMIGFAGINIPFDIFCRSKDTNLELENRVAPSNEEDHVLQ